MAQTVSHLTQSRYYSPAFNAAVFDGPIRIYFAQHQEALALKVYFRLQTHLKDSFALARQTFKQSGQTIFVMLYPTIEAFSSSFSKTEFADVVVENLGTDFVLGIRGPLEDAQYEMVYKEVDKILSSSTHPELVVNI
jgi:hypothetical protein